MGDVWYVTRSHSRGGRRGRERDDPGRLAGRGGSQVDAAAAGRAGCAQAVRPRYGQGCRACGVSGAAAGVRAPRKWAAGGPS